MAIKERKVLEGGLIKKIQKSFEKSAVLSTDNPFIDFPEEKEHITSPSYVIRISAEAGSDVDISINDSKWEPCRSSVGYWWFDWQAGGSSKVTIAARSRVGNGRWKKSDVRTCFVDCAVEKFTA